MSAKKGSTRQVARWILVIAGVVCCGFGLHIAVASGLFGSPVDTLTFATPLFRIMINNPRIEQGTILMAIGFIVLYLFSRVE